MAGNDDVSDLDRLEAVPEDAPPPEIEGGDDDDVDEEDREERGEEDEEEGEDLLENMEQDYRAMPHLDRYDAADIDDEPEEDADVDAYEARVAAEAAMDRRDAVGGRRKRLPDALAETEEDLDFRSRRQRRELGDLAPEAAANAELRVDEVRGRLSEWITQEPVANEVKRVFRNMLKTHVVDGHLYYKDRIMAMQRTNSRNLEVLYSHIAGYNSLFAMWTADCPRHMLEYFDAAAREVVVEMYGDDLAEASGMMGSDYEVHVRIAGLPLAENIRDLRNYHLGCLVKVSGVVTRRSGVFPQLRLVKYDCVKCGFVMGPFAMNTEVEVKPNACPSCQSKGPFSVNSSETVYRDFQKLTLQESPGKVPAGRLPRHKEVILTHDLIDCARPGEEIEVTGMYVYSYDMGLNIKNSFPVFSTHLEANYVSKREDLFSVYALTDEDKADILTLAKDPRIGQRIMKSIAPSIYGHEFIKTGLALALFGGQEKNPSPAHRLRGDINVLLLGDPGVAKSQFLKYVEKTAVRAVFTTGKGASAVGLTASVHRDSITKEWTLEGGALVLADKGVCLIDEFDKMNDQDRVSIHEAMEQQSISISKAGIVTSLQARCSVIAAANPVGGRYDPSRTFAENVELSDPILSRFDVLCVVRDIVDPVNDQKLAEFVVGSHKRSHPDLEASTDELGPTEDVDILPQALLRKYITYSKQNCRPVLQEADYDRITEVYARLRAEASRTHGMPVAVRHLESVVRMSEAHARMHLRDYVSDDDISVAIKMMVGSFIQTQKYSVHKTLQAKFKRYLTLPSDFHRLLLTMLQTLLREEQRNARILGSEPAPGGVIKLPLRGLEEKAREHEIHDLSEFLESDLLTSSGFTLLPGSTTITYAVA